MQRITLYCGRWANISEVWPLRGVCRLGFGLLAEEGGVGVDAWEVGCPLGVFSGRAAGCLPAEGWPPPRWRASASCIATVFSFKVPE